MLPMLSENYNCNGKNRQLYFSFGQEFILLSLHLISLNKLPSNTKCSSVHYFHIFVTKGNVTVHSYFQKLSFHIHSISPGCTKLHIAWYQHWIKSPCDIKGSLVMSNPLRINISSILPHSYCTFHLSVFAIMWFHLPTHKLNALTKSNMQVCKANRPWQLKWSHPTNAKKGWNGANSRWGTLSIS